MTSLKTVSNPVVCHFCECWNRREMCIQRTELSEIYRLTPLYVCGTWFVYTALIRLLLAYTSEGGGVDRSHIGIVQDYQADIPVLIMASLFTNKQST